MAISPAADRSHLGILIDGAAPTCLTHPRTRHGSAPLQERCPISAIHTDPTPPTCANNFTFAPGFGPTLYSVYFTLKTTTLVIADFHVHPLLIWRTLHFHFSNAMRRLVSA